MRKTKKWIAVFLAVVMIGALFSESMSPVMAKADSEAVQTESEEEIKDSEMPDTEEEEQTSDMPEENLQEEGETKEEEPETVKEPVKEPEKVPDRQEEPEKKAEKQTIEEPELKEAESKQESGTSGTTVELKSISVKEDISLDQIATPETFTVQVDLDATEDFEVYYMELEYRNEKTGNIFTFSEDYYENPWSPTRDGTNEISVKFSEYAPEGEYTLVRLSIETYHGGITYEEDEETLYLSMHPVAIDVIWWNYQYHGEADCIITDSQTDTSLPEVTNIRMLSGATICSGENIKFEVDYSEEGSGVKMINVTCFEIEGDATIIASVSDLEEGRYTGDGTIEVTTDEFSEIYPGKYEIGFVTIEDCSGNIRDYQQTGAEGLISYSEEEPLIVVPEIKEFEVQNTRSNGLKVKDMRIEGVSDKDNLAAGDSFEVVVTIYNDIEKTVPVRPEWCFIRWFDLYDWEEDGSMEVTAEGERFTLAPGAQADLHFPVKISSYSETKTYILDQLSLNAQKNSGFTPCTWYNAGNNELLGYGSTADDPYNSGIMEVLPYNGEIDWAVTTPTSTPDNKAPIIESVTVNPLSTTAPGKIELEIKTKGEEVSDINRISWSFQDKTQTDNDFAGSNTDPEELSDEAAMVLGNRYYSPLSYSSERNCYIAEIELDEKIIRGTYYLSQISLGDEAGNMTDYYYNKESKRLEAFLDDGRKVNLSACEFTVSESASPDEDFTSPILEDIILQKNQAEAGEVIQCRIKVEDETGLSRIRLDYEYDSDQDGETDTYMSLESRNIILQGDEYICDFVVDPYCTAGEYDLSGIFLMDGSIRPHYSYYMYDKISNTILNGDMHIQMPAGRSFALTVTQPQEDMVVTDLMNDNVLNAAEGVTEGGTIVVKGSYLEEGSYYMFPAEFFEVAKERKLTVIIPDSLGDSEIVVKGGDLEAIPNMDPELRIKRENLVEGEAGVENDDLYYPVSVVASDTAIPLTIRVKVDNEFLEQCGKNPVRISKVGEDGTPTILAKKVTVGEDGYVEFNFPNGLQGTGEASQVLYSNGDGQKTTQEKYSFMISSQKEEGEVMLGDINGDGRINLVDLMQCLNHVGRKESLNGKALLAADINQDGGVNLVDLMRLLNFVGRKTDKL